MDAVITLGAAVVFTLWVLYFRGAIFPGSQFREKKSSFQCVSGWRSLKHYNPVLPAALPALLAAVVVIHHRVESVRGPGFARPCSGICRSSLCRDGAHADARGRHHALGRPISAERGPDGRLRIRAAQFLHPVQCADRRRVPAPRPARVVRSVMANALTAVRLALALPVAVALARPELLAPGVVALLIGLAIVTDALDGPSRGGRGRRRPSGCCSTQHGLPLRHQRLDGRRHCRIITPILAALIPVRVRSVRRRFLLVASPAAAARQLSRAVERHPLLRADRARRRVAIAVPGGLRVAPAAGGGCARVPARGVDRGVHARSCDDAVQITRPDEFLDHF